MPAGLHRRQNKALQQNRDDVLRYGESIGCDLLKAAVSRVKANPECVPSRCEV
jgi:hypothetical protein